MPHPLIWDYVFLSCVALDRILQPFSQLTGGFVSELQIFFHLHKVIWCHLQGVVFIKFRL